MLDASIRADEPSGGVQGVFSSAAFTAGTASEANACTPSATASTAPAAIEGHGVALARSVMAHDVLASERLVRLLPDISFAYPLAYYVVYRPECARLPRLAAFRDWLLKEAASYRGESLHHCRWMTVYGRRGGCVTSCCRLLWTNS